jgi:hypothetical protein
MLEVSRQVADLRSQFTTAAHPTHHLERVQRLGVTGSVGLENGDHAWR